MRSIADQPYSPVTRTHGESAGRRDDDLVDLVVEDLLHDAEALGGGLGLLELLLLLLGLLHLEASLVALRPPTP